MELIDVIRKLNGPIDPVGDSAIDSMRFINLESLCMLVDKLLFDIHVVADMNNSQQASVKKAGDYARKYLQEVKDADL